MTRVVREGWISDADDIYENETEEESMIGVEDTARELYADGVFNSDEIFELYGIRL